MKGILYLLICTCKHIVVLLQPKAKYYLFFMKKNILLLAAVCLSMVTMAEGSATDSLAQKRAAINRINESNENNCLVVTEMLFEYDSIPREKTDYKYDKDGNMTAGFYYEMTDTGWLCNRYEFFQSTFLPYDTTTCQFTHKWSYDSLIWQPVVGTKTQITFSNNVQTTYSWKTAPNDTTQWVGDQKQERRTDANGRVTEYVSYEMTNGQWVNSWRSEYAYNADGKQTMQVSYVWMDGAWKAFDKTEEIESDTAYFYGSYYHNENYDSLVLMNRVYYRFDANGDTLLHIWGADGDRIYTKDVYTYENGVLASKIEYKESNYYPYDLVMTAKNYYRMDAQKRVIEKKTLAIENDEIQSGSLMLISYAFADDNTIASIERQDSVYNEWELLVKTEYTYTESRLPLTEITSNYQPKLNRWVYDSKKETAYNENEWFLYFIEYQWDAEANRWQGVSKDETEYNANGEAVSSISYRMNWGDTTWIPQHAVVRSFDIYGNWLGEGWYRRDESTQEWINLGKQLFVYVCGSIPTPAQPVIVEPGHDFVTFAWLSYEDANTYTLTVLSSDRSDTIAIMNFNSFGELIGQSAPLGVKRRTASPSSSSVFTCLIEGLETGTNYCYVMEAKNAEEQVVHSENGNFKTDGDDVAVENVGSNGSNDLKIIRDGVLLIRHDGQWYNAMGQRIQ